MRGSRPGAGERAGRSDVSRAARFAALIATMHAAHNVGDHIVQTDDQAARKMRPDGWGALAGHVASYHAVQLAALLVANRLLGLRLPAGRTAVALAVSAGTHALLDRRWPVRRLLEATGSSGFARGTYQLARDQFTHVQPVQAVPLNGPYLADQALHHAALWLAALIAASGRPIDPV